jgi:restriction system protein
MPKVKAQTKGPQFVRYFAPLIRALRDLGGSGRPSEVEPLIVDALGVTDDELNEVTKNGQSRFRNQVAWARFYLVKAGLVESSVRGVWNLTEKGLQSDLSQESALLLFKEVHKAFAKNGAESDAADEDDVAGQSPPEDAAPIAGYRDELLSILKNLPPAGFEKVCQRLLRESGFEQVTITGRSGDGGFDGHGVLLVNAFVSFRVLFQCKRYDNTAVSASQVRDFRGAVTGRTDKGIILTTGTFSADARKEALRDGAPPIELVDGDRLVDMFRRLELGLNPVQTYEVNHSFFEEFK